MDNGNNNSGFVPLTGLWKNKEKGHLSGKSGQTVYFVFPNEHRRNENDPEFRLVVAEARKREEPTEAKDDGDDKFGF